MNIMVSVKLVPDLVEELEIDESGTALDTTWLRLMLNEFDGHAIEQAILLKERAGGQAIIVAPDAEDVDDVLFTAAAKGADRLIKLTGESIEGVSNHSLACMLKPVVEEIKPDLVLTGVQAHNDLDGSMGPLLAEFVGMPYVGYVSGLEVDTDRCVVRKEYPGGLIAEMEVALPAVLGIQAAEEPPRYVAVSKVRQAMKTATIEEHTVTESLVDGRPNIIRMFQPESSEKAEMIEGSEEEIAARLVEIFQELGVL